MFTPEGHYADIVESIFRNNPQLTIDGLSPEQKDFHFAMQSNGYFHRSDGRWEFYPQVPVDLNNGFAAQKVSFFGPLSHDRFFSPESVGFHETFHALKQKSVTDSIRRSRGASYQPEHEHQSARLAFLLGGLVRHQAIGEVYLNTAESRLAKSVDYVAKMSLLAERPSMDAVVSALSMYAISGADLGEDREFTGQIYHMAEAISRNDSTPITETAALGLSQTRRIRAYLEKISRQPTTNLPDISEYERSFINFPTVGGEWHFDIHDVQQNPTIWKKLALLNMSQYQPNSYIQMSRDDRDVIEVRMNPSTYPIAIPTWNYMQQILPELNQSYFTITLNRSDQNFTWDRDTHLINNLRALGLLTYASIVPHTPLVRNYDEINFGLAYLGQTVRVNERGRYDFTGNWLRGSGIYGQLGLYVGYGETFPDLAYYLSTGLAHPGSLDHSRKRLEGIDCLQKALSQNPRELRGIFHSIQGFMENNSRLRKTWIDGNQIIQSLSPNQS